MPELAVRNIEGQEVGSVELSDAAFSVPMNSDLVHQAVAVVDSRRKFHCGNGKSRGDVAGSQAKIWRQKGLGRARHGNRKAPTFVGGGKAHGPQPRSGNKQMPKKMRRRALFCALSEARRHGHVHIVETIELEKPRTKTIVRLLDGMGLSSQRVMLMVSAAEMANANLVKSCRNVPTLQIRQAPHLNARDVLVVSDIVFTQGALAALDELSGGAE